jgi:hypothetical protein
MDLRSEIMRVGNEKVRDSQSAAPHGVEMQNQGCGSLVFLLKPYLGLRRAILATNG